jgi:hypothetical protein
MDLNGLISGFYIWKSASEDIRFACKVAQIAEVDHTALLFDESFTKFFDSETIDCIIKEIELLPIISRLRRSSICPSVQRFDY